MRWGKLKGKSQFMLKLRAEFVQEFQEKGFGFVEGSKWINMIDQESYTSKDSYKTEKQIYAAEEIWPEGTQAKINTAKAMGKGVPPPGPMKG